MVNLNIEVSVVLGEQIIDVSGRYILTFRVRLTYYTNLYLRATAIRIRRRRQRAALVHAHVFSGCIVDGISIAIRDDGLSVMVPLP